MFKRQRPWGLFVCLPQIAVFKARSVYWRAELRLTLVFKRTSGQSKVSVAKCQHEKKKIVSENCIVFPISRTEPFFSKVERASNKFQLYCKSYLKNCL